MPLSWRLLRPAASRSGRAHIHDRMLLCCLRASVEVSVDADLDCQAALVTRTLNTS